MSVHVIDTSNPSAWVIQDDDNGHVGTADPSTLRFVPNLDGTTNNEVVVIPCPEPGCDTASSWPRELLPPEVTAKLA